MDLRGKKGDDLNMQSAHITKMLDKVYIREIDHIVGKKNGIIRER